jgi:hypothetical protein
LIFQKNAVKSLFLVAGKNQKTMRTLKRKMLSPNTSLNELCHAYGREKQHWLQHFQAWKFQSHLGQPRIFRDELIKQGYRSSHKLQARHWKLALQEAAETWDKYWQATFVQVRLKIPHRKNLSEIERHYAFWLIKSYSSFAAMMQGKYSEPPFPIEKSTQRRTASFVRRVPSNAEANHLALKKLEASDSMPTVTTFFNAYTVDMRTYRIGLPH